MLTDRIDTLGSWAADKAKTLPWTNVYGVARTLLAASTIGTLLFNGSTLFEPSPADPTVPHCAGIGGISLFCRLPAADIPWARVIGIVVLLVAASGYRPRWTALPHWWIAFSVASSIAVEDGGDQLVAVLTLLILPVALSDARTWVWSQEQRYRRHESMWRIIALSAMTAIRVQTAIVYFQSSVAKLGVHDWASGTALYYFLNNAVVGAPNWLRPLLEPFLRNGICVEILTYGALLIEFGLFLGLFAPKRWRRPLLIAGLVLHGGIAVCMGLPSFALAMAGALIMYLRPWDEPFTTKAEAGSVLAWTHRRRHVGEMSASTAKTERVQPAPASR